MHALTCDLHWLYGQYPWSTMTGLPTLFMVIPLKVIPSALPAEGEAGHVLILTPFIVLVKVQSRTLMRATGCSLKYLPRLPMLIPWPGPHLTLWIVTSLLPSPREIQSSPVPIVVSETVISFERPMWIPSVLRLVVGAVMVICWIFNLLHPKTLMWKLLGSLNVMPWITPFVMKSSLKVCSFMKTKQPLG